MFAGFRTVFVLVVPSKLSWGSTLEVFLPKNGLIVLNPSPKQLCLLHFSSILNLHFTTPSLCCTVLQYWIYTLLHCTFHSCTTDHRNTLNFTIQNYTELYFPVLSYIKDCIKTGAHGHLSTA